MVKYCDYFPKSILFKCNISPDKSLEIEEESFYLKNRDENILNSMKKIYNSFTDSLGKNFDGNIDKVLNSMGINRKIVALFYDLDILKSSDIEKYPLDFDVSKENKNLCFDGEQKSSFRENLILEDLDVKKLNSKMEKSKPIETEKEKVLDKGILK